MEPHEDLTQGGPSPGPGYHRGFQGSKDHCPESRRVQLKTCLLQEALPDAHLLTAGECTSFDLFNQTADGFLFFFFFVTSVLGISSSPPTLVTISNPGLDKNDLRTRSSPQRAHPGARTGRFLKPQLLLLEVKGSSQDMHCSLFPF